MNYRAPKLTVKVIPSGESQNLRRYLKKQARKRQRSNARIIITLELW